MTDPRELHDPDVDGAWRAHVRDEPPASMDQAILAAAHRAVNSAPRATTTRPRSGWRAWAPLAVAATLGVVAFGIVELLPRDRETDSAVMSDVPSEALQKEQPAGAPATPPAPAPVESRADVNAPKPAAPAMEQPAPVEDKAAARDAPPKQAARALAQRSERAEPQAFPATPRAKVEANTAAAPVVAATPAPPPPAAAPAPSPAPAPADLAAARTAQNGALVDRVAPTLRAQSAPAKTAATRTPDDFIRDIERLRAQGRDADAALALSAFRAAYTDADTRLPESLRAWARTVARP